MDDEPRQFHELNSNAHMSAKTFSKREKVLSRLREKGNREKGALVLRVIQSCKTTQTQHIQDLVQQVALLLKTPICLITLEQVSTFASGKQ